MADRYLTTVNGGVAKTLVKRLGLPQPSTLRRYAPGEPLVPGPVLVLGPTPAPAAAASTDPDALAEALLSFDLDVRRAPAGADRWGAIIVVLTSVEDPGDLSGAAIALGATLRNLAPGGRIVTISRAPADDDVPRLAATRQGIEGFVRSLAKELRNGATGNGIQLANGAAPTSPSVLATLRFLLSGRSAFVDGQLLRVGTSDGAAPGELPGPTPESPRTGGAPLAGRVAVVTGAARGIGAAIARTLHRDGATIVAVDLPAAGEALAAIANEVEGTTLQLDVTAEDAGARILGHARSRHGGLHILVHNAGILRDKLLANMSTDQWDAVVAVNLTAQLRITEQILAADGFADAPRIVSLASTSGIAGNKGQTNYGFSKAGVIGATRATAALLAARGGTANAVAPGFIETDMTASIPLVAREMARRASSLQQGGQPIDVAETVAFLASPGAAGINGAIVRVCGQNLVGQ